MNLSQTAMADELPGMHAQAGACLWLSLTQLLASAAGGYLAGRLRSRWSGVLGKRMAERKVELLALGA